MAAAVSPNIKHLLYYQQGPIDLFVEFSKQKSSPTLSLINLSVSVVETVICRQNSWLYGVDDIFHNTTTYNNAMHNNNSPPGNKYLKKIINSCCV